MAGIEDYNCEGSLTIGSVSLSEPQWAVLGDQDGEGGCLDLLTKVERRGENRMLPSADGFIAYPKRKGETRIDLRLLVTGDLDENGAETANSSIGLAHNLDYLYDALVETVEAGDGTATLTWVFGDITVTGAVQVLGMEKQRYGLGDDSSVWEGTLQLNVVGGRLAVS